MKFKKIVGFGDSWMHGDELLDPALANDPTAHYSWIQNTAYRESNCFLGLLGQHYGVPTENYGIPGGSLRSTMWTYLWWLEREPDPKNCLVLIMLTEADRESFYNPIHVDLKNQPWNPFVHSTWVECSNGLVPAAWRDMVKQFMVLSSCSELRKLNYLETVHFFNGQYTAGINLMQMHTMPPPVRVELPSIPHPDFHWCHYFRDHVGNQKRELIMPGGHPNEKGHELIRDHLIQDIDLAILIK